VQLIVVNIWEQFVEQQHHTTHRKERPFLWVVSDNDDGYWENHNYDKNNDT
jgi:hypothetical protein